MSVFTQNVIHAIARVVFVGGLPTFLGSGVRSVAPSGVYSTIVTLQDPIGAGESLVLLGQEAGVGPTGDGPRYTRPTPDTIEVSVQLNGSGFPADYSIAVLRIPHPV